MNVPSRDVDDTELNTTGRLDSLRDDLTLAVFAGVNMPNDSFEKLYRGCDEVIEMDNIKINTAITWRMFIDDNMK